MTSWRPSRSMPSPLPASWVARCRVWSLGQTAQRLVRFVMLWGFSANTQLRWSKFRIAWMFSQVVEEISKVQGVKKVLVAQHDCYKGFLPGKWNASSWWQNLTLCLFVGPVFGRKEQVFKVGNSLQQEYVQQESRIHSVKAVQYLQTWSL